MTDRPDPLPDDLGARLQARVRQIEHDPSLAGPRRAHRDRVAPDADRVEPAPDDAVAGVADLNAQLDVLRHQLETAFDDVDDRIAAAEARVAQAETRAEEADHRAQVASARAANVLAAVDELATDLASIAERADPETAPRLLSAVARLRARLQPT